MSVSSRLSSLVSFPARTAQRLTALKPGLSAKLLWIIVLVSLMGVLTSSFFVLNLQRQQLEESALLAATQHSKVINVSLEHTMLGNDRDMLNHIIQTLVDKRSIDSIRILDSKGIVRISSTPSQIGQQYDYTQSTCQFCHPGGMRPGNHTAIVDTGANHKELLNMNLIYNDLQCQVCHDAQQKVLGITMIEMPLDNLNAELADGFWRIALSSLVTLGFLIVLMMVVLRRLVVRPVEALTRGMTEIRRGNLDYLLPRVPTGDELGELADSFNTLRAELKSSRNENIELQKRTHSLAILEERDRLAREMHDNLAQTLGYINLKAALADNQLVSNRLGEVRASLSELKRAAKEAYTDVRESIFNLRTNGNGGDGLLPILTNCVDQYRTQTGIDVSFSIEDERLAQFPTEVQVQVHRIIQEALTNVRKHSNARRVSLRVERVNDCVCICVEDDGKGFDASAVTLTGQANFGLKIMRERAQSVGGELEIDSQSGAGTRVNLYLPIYPVFEDPHEDTSYSAS